MTRVSVLGAGSWGTALALHAHGVGHDVRLLFRTREHVGRVRATRENESYLPGVPLPRDIILTHRVEEALADDSDLILVTTPVKGLELAARWLREAAAGSGPVVCCAKGIRPDDLQTPTEFLSRAVPGIAERLVALSGPTFAAELARGHPSAAVVAGRSPSMARQVQTALSGGSLRLYVNTDVRGVELAGALKNVMALAAGVVDGLGFGANTLAALVTRGLSEMTRLAVAAGGHPSTLSGLAGLGDLILTCTGALSRNRSVGQALGRGRSLDEIAAGMHMVAEGVPTSRAALALARRFDVEMPIAAQVAAILFDGVRPEEAMQALLSRELREEDRFDGEASEV